MLSVLFYIILLVFTFAYFLLLCVAFVLTVPFDRNRRVIHRLCRIWTKCYFAIVPTWRVDVKGRENIEKNTSYVVVVNHRSMIDIALMFVLPFDFKWVSKKEVYKWPLFGWALWLRGDIAIERGSSSAVRKMMRDGKRYVDDGISVVIFPEGSRNRTDGVNKFREGAFTLAKSVGVGILPCVITGTDTALRGWRINFKNVYRVRILTPVPPEKVQAEDPHDLASEVHDLMASEYEKLKNKEN